MSGYSAKKNFILTLWLLLPFTLFAQPAPPFQDEDLPKDYLTASFHAGRRDALREIMPANSVAAIFAYPTRTFSNDVNYIFHQNPDLYYFSGYKEPHSLLLIFKEAQLDSAGVPYNEILFVQKKNPVAEHWSGKRLGTEGAQKKLGIPMSFNAGDFKNFNIDFSKFEKILFDRFPSYTVEKQWGDAELFGLM